MCGIAGEFIFAHKGIIDPENVLTMAMALSHRGPDDWGYYINTSNTALLINTRLAIVDVLGGRQPLSNEDGSIWMVCNGEIYNSLQLKKELENKGHRFKTTTDVEVIIHLYEEIGIGFVEHLRGEFAIGLLDGKTQTAYLVRDRFGIKPLYYTLCKDRLIFASEIKAIFTHQKIDNRELNYEHLYHTLNTIMMPENTMFKNINQLKPGHILVFDQVKSDVRLFNYWNIANHLCASDDLKNHNEEDVIQEFGALLRESVGIRLQGEAKIGAYLSGGIDSTAIVQIMHAKSIKKFPTFTIAFNHKQYDESELTKGFIGDKDLEHYMLNIGPGTLASSFIESLWHSEIPVINGNGTAKFLLSKLASQHHTKVVLTGEGADELLLGYNQFSHLMLLEALHKDYKNKKLRKELRQFHQEHGLLSGVTSTIKLNHYEEVKKIFGAYPYLAIRAFIIQKKLARFLSADFLNRTKDINSLQQLSDRIRYSTQGKMNSVVLSQYLSFETDLSNYILNYLGDRQEMAHSIEGRVPFLDHQLVEFVCKLPLKFKLRDQQNKYLLRQSMLYSVPMSHDLKKRVFTAPSDALFMHNENSGLLRYYLSRKMTEETNVFNHQKIKILQFALKTLPKNSSLHHLASTFLTMILSVHILDDLFCKNFKSNIQLYGSIKQHHFDVQRGRVY